MVQGAIEGTYGQFKEYVLAVKDFKASSHLPLPGKAGGSREWPSVTQAAFQIPKTSSSESEPPLVPQTERWKC